MQAGCRSTASATAAPPAGQWVLARRFLYDPPPAWQVLPCRLVANWYPPDYPDNRANLIVYPANPADAGPQDVHAALLAEDRESGVRAARVAPPAPLRSRHGLSGLRFRDRGSAAGFPAWYSELVVFKEGRYLYTLRLTSCQPERQAEHERLLLAVADSAHPLPLSLPAGLRTAAISSHWSD